MNSLKEFVQIRISLKIVQSNGDGSCFCDTKRAHPLVAVGWIQGKWELESLIDLLRRNQLA
jgi:hypothetical protein